MGEWGLKAEWGLLVTGVWSAAGELSHPVSGDPATEIQVANELLRLGVDKMRLIKKKSNLKNGEQHLSALGFEQSEMVSVYCLKYQIQSNLSVFFNNERLQKLWVDPRKNK